MCPAAGRGSLASAGRHTWITDFDGDLSATARKSHRDHESAPQMTESCRSVLVYRRLFRRFARVFAENAPTNENAPKKIGHLAPGFYDPGDFGANAKTLRDGGRSRAVA